jgi:hypothetical protein
MTRQELTERRDDLRENSRFCKSIAAGYICFTLFEIGVSEFNMARIVAIGGAVVTSAIGTHFAYRSVEFSNKAESINTVLIHDDFVNGTVNGSTPPDSEIAVTT